MPHPHDFAGEIFILGPGCYNDILRSIRGIADQAMIARRFKGIVQTGKDPFAVVMNLLNLAVH